MIHFKRDIEYDYVLCSPPDFDELGEEKDLNYSNFVDTWAHYLIYTGNFVTFVYQIENIMVKYYLNIVK